MGNFTCLRQKDNFSLLIIFLKYLREILFLIYDSRKRRDESRADLLTKTTNFSSWLF